MDSMKKPVPVPKSRQLAREEFLELYSTLALEEGKTGFQVRNALVIIEGSFNSVKNNVAVLEFFKQQLELFITDPRAEPHKPIITKCLKRLDNYIDILFYIGRN